MSTNKIFYGPDLFIFRSFPFRVITAQFYGTIPIELMSRYGSIKYAIEGSSKITESSNHLSPAFELNFIIFHFGGYKSN